MIIGSGDIDAAVNVCIATHNAQDFIARTLDSLLSQSYRNFRCIISDDASSDKTIDICQQYQESDPRISVYYNKIRLGWVDNVNRSLKYAIGSKYLMIFPHDDVVAPTYLERLILELEANPGSVVAFSDMEVIRPGLESKVLVYDRLDAISRSKMRAVTVLDRKGHWWVPYRGVFRTTVYKKTGGLRKHWRGEFVADFPWVMKLAIQGEFVRVPEILYTKHVREEGVSNQWNYDLLNWIAAYCSCFQVVFVSKMPIADSISLYYRIIQSFFARVRRFLNRRHIKTKRALGER